MLASLPDALHAQTGVSHGNQGTPPWPSVKTSAQQCLNHHNDKKPCNIMQQCR